jgi:PAS domain S-box-containing protein
LGWFGRLKARLRGHAWVEASLQASLREAIAARAEAQAAQKHAELAEKVAGLGYWRLDCRTGEVTSSGSLARLYGGDVSMSHDMAAIRDLMPPEEREAADLRMRRAVTHGEPYEAETRIVRPDGSVRVLSVRGVPERDENGAIVAVFGTMLDITQQKHVEAALAESERSFRLLAEGAVDAIVRAKLMGEMIYVSPAAEQLTGYSHDELMKGGLIACIHPEDLPAVEEAYEEILTGARPPGAIEYRIRHQAGHWIWLENKPTLVRDAEGQPIEWIDISRDITVRKEMEAELEAARAAEAAAVAKSDFLANMSHELRTPLTGIIGYAGLLAATCDLDSKAAHFAKRIVAAGKVLHAVVNDILDFSKLESGQLELDRHAFDPREFLPETLSLVSVQAEAKGLSLTAAVDDDVPVRVRQDSVRLRQILLNLAGNAVKFTESGSVDVRMSYLSEDGGRLRVCVADSGVGISPAGRALLFQRFSQVDGSSARTHGGSGLGLAICKGLTDLMGGDIGVESVEGQGSTFWFEAPAPPVSGEDSTDAA